MTIDRWKVQVDTIVERNGGTPRVAERISSAGFVFGMLAVGNGFEQLVFLSSIQEWDNDYV